MLKTIIDKASKQWLLVSIVIVALFLSGVAVYASYEQSNGYDRMKRVVAAIKDNGMMFSSNYLVENGSSTYVAKYVSDNEGAHSYTIDVYLWNYDISNPSKKYPETINYDLSATLVGQDGTAYTSEQLAEKLDSKVINLLDGNGNVIDTFSSSKGSFTVSSQSLAYSAASVAEKKYTIEFPSNWDLDDTDVCVQLVATPNNGGDSTKYKDLKPISAVIGLRESVAVGSQGWTAYISEEKAGKTIAECSGYNVVASGSGQATIKIIWNPNYVRINEYFYVDGKKIYTFGSGEVTYTASIPAGDSDSAYVGWSRIVIAADASSSTTGYRNRYDMQLYRVGGFTPSAWSSSDTTFLEGKLIMTVE